MDQPARLYLCARCRVQVVLCRRCDRGNRYCGRACWRQARAEARRQAAQRYQRSWRGRLAHALRARRWRQRRAARDAAEAAHNVTHQGSQPGVPSAPLAAWTHDHVTVGLAHTTAEAAADTSADTPAHSAPPERAIAITGWACRRCGARQPAALRLGFLRHGVLQRRRHDHSP